MVTSTQKKNNHASLLYKTIKGRPDASEISRRNRQKKKESVKLTDNSKF
jgi:hypothetical protein